tara:strand:- start:972 stop:1385 length:414 start_codon:yes stop_codon:yes gene_type:complete
MRKVEAGMVASIMDAINSDKSGRVYSCGNTSVDVIHQGIRNTYGYNRFIEVNLHENTIATIYPDLNRIHLSDCGYETATTKSRLNVLIQCFTDESTIHQNQHVWYQGDDLWESGEIHRFFHKHPDDCWQVKQALKLA